MENGVFLFSAFSIVWAVVFGYVLFLINRQKQLRRDIDLIKKIIKGKEGK
ncbi:CcmD family protein [Chloroflexota bacterium]